MHTEIVVLWLEFSLNILCRNSWFNQEFFGSLEQTFPKEAYWILSN